MGNLKRNGPGCQAFMVLVELFLVDLSEQKELKRSLFEADELGFRWADPDANLPPLKHVAGVDLRCFLSNTCAGAMAEVQTPQLYLPDSGAPADHEPNFFL